MKTELPCILIEITELLEDLHANYKSFLDPDELDALVKITKGNALFGCTVLADLSQSHDLFNPFLQTKRIQAPPCSRKTKPQITAARPLL